MVDDQVNIRRQMLEQEGKGFVNQFGINHMIVIQYKHEIIWNEGDLVEQGCQNRFGWLRLRGLENRQHFFSKICRNRLQSSDEVSQKTREVVILFVQ